MVTNESNKSINCSFPRSSSSLITLQNLTPEMFSLRRSSSMMSLFKSGGSSPKGKETIVVEKNSKQFREDSSTSNVSKLHRRTKNLKVSELDFGCAGELAELMEEPFIVSHTLLFFDLSFKSLLCGEKKKRNGSLFLFLLYLFLSRKKVIIIIMLILLYPQ